MRIYVVNSNGNERLIEASSKAQALAYAVNTTMSVELASQADLVRMIGEKVAVESAQVTE